jgi:hypothetical protein
MEGKWRREKVNTKTALNEKKDKKEISFSGDSIKIERRIRDTGNELSDPLQKIDTTQKCKLPYPEQFGPQLAALLRFRRSSCGRPEGEAWEYEAIVKYTIRTG